MRCWLLLLIAALSFAQDETPVFRTEVSLVKVDAEVQDAQGVGIGGLRPGDFVVYDENQRQKIVDFAAESQPVRHPDAAGRKPQHVEVACGPGRKEYGGFAALCVPETRWR